ncbi:MAG: heme-binding domain-containing protein [Candidatus Latescibacteria bacterium]|jgi:hypothetical protein|nr:heme-binding domain-containing protein [Candidatus Latescibacterota bacterium]
MRRKILIGIAVLFLLIQIIPVERANPPVEIDLGAPAEVDAVLRSSCYDCHSNETRWPWYAYVAPTSFLITRHVEEAREHLNFSRWNRYPEGRQRYLVEKMIEEVDKEKMPLPAYILIHRSARVAPEGLDLLRTWASEHYGWGPAAE